MKPTQKQFSLNREASKKQFTISNSVLGAAFVLFFWGDLVTLRAESPPCVKIAVEIESMTLKVDGAVQTRRNFSVECWVATNGWLIKNDFVHNAEEVWAWDGTTVLHSARPTAPETNRAALAMLEKSGLMIRPFHEVSNTVTVYVQGNFEGHPTGNVGVNIPWLAFCSADYLARQSRLIPIPVADLDKAADGFAYQDKTVCFDPEPGLPQAVELLASLDLLEKSIRLPHFAGVRDLAAYLRSRPGFRNDALKFSYRVTKQTNVLGRIWPTEFSWFQNESTSEGNWYRRFVGSGKVTSIGLGVMPAFFPSNRETTVVDSRLRIPSNTNVPLTYAFTGNKLAPTNDPKLQVQLANKSEKIKQAMAASQSTPHLNHQSSPRPMLRFIFAASLGSLAAILYLSFRRRPQNTTKIPNDL